MSNTDQLAVNTIRILSAEACRRRIRDIRVCPSAPHLWLTRFFQNI